MAPDYQSDDDSPDRVNDPHPDWTADDEQPVSEQAFDETEADLSASDLEAAYLRAMEAVDSAEWAMDPDADAQAECVEAESLSEGSAESSFEPSASSSGTDIAGADFLGNPVPQSPSAETSSGGGQTLSPEDKRQPVAENLKPARVIEACLFVGGQPLSAKKLANVLEGNNEPSVIEGLIDELNLEYAAQLRPYEIRLGDGGYRLTLRSEFDVVRNRVFGVGPRDVKLSQEVLEVLALVAYQQPMTHAAIEACKPNSANLLRQLLRRELISLNRIDQTRTGVEYRTTQRFLQLFGLGQLSELPRPEDLSIR